MLSITVFRSVEATQYETGCSIVSCERNIMYVTAQSWRFVRQMISLIFNPQLCSRENNYVTDAVQELGQIFVLFLFEVKAQALNALSVN